MSNKWMDHVPASGRIFLQDDENRSKSEDGSIGISVRFGTGQRRATNLGIPLAIRCQLVISSPLNPAFGCCP